MKKFDANEDTANIIIELLEQVLSILKVHEMRLNDTENYILEEIQNELN